MKVLFLGIALLAVIGTPDAAQAKDWAVSKIEYKNKGGYLAFMEFRTENAAGDVQICGLKRKKVGTQGSKTVAIDGSDGKQANNACTIINGDEVWAVIDLRFGESLGTAKTSNCRKDKARYFYHPDGGTVTVFTKGTLAENNRCRIESNGGVRWIRSTHGRTIYKKHEDGLVN